MLYRRIARRHWFVAISESQRSLAPEELRWAGVVYNGIPMDRYPLRQDKDDYLLFLGRADEEKAPDLAIAAAREAGRRLVMCVTTKNERERAYWAERVEPLLGDDVEVRDEVSQQEKAELLAGAAALLFPIQWPEPFGLVMTEAMACGTPVIAWRNGSVPRWWPTARPALSCPRWRRWRPRWTGWVGWTPGSCASGSRSGSRPRP
jgi:glycosyltransferase involved in cell wall biosynthesis